MNVNKINKKRSFLVNMGGQYMPETLMNAVNQLEEAYLKYKDDPDFVRE